MRFEMPSSPGSTYPNGAIRRYPRALFSVPISVYHLDVGGVRCSHGISLDISEGGLAALVQSGLEVGETVKIDLPLAKRAISTVAIVRHSSEMRSGFEFVGLTPEERGQIATASSPLFAADS